MTDPILQVGADSLSKIADYSLAGSCIVLIILILAYAVRYLMEQFKLCHESTKQALDKNTEAFHGVQLALVKLETKLEK